MGARGFGGHVTSTSEENHLYSQKNKWRGMDMGAHEVAHNFHLTGLERGKPSIFSADLKECKDEDSQCSRWAKEGYCFSNAGYMSIACQRSCDVCDLSICADNHERCEEWAAENECSKNKGYMRV